MAITNFTPGFTIDTITSPKTGWSKGLSLGASNKVSLSNPLGDLNIEPKAGQNLLGNLNMGQVATAALPMLTGLLEKSTNKNLENMTPQQRAEFEAIYGSGEGALKDLFSMKQNTQNVLDSIQNSTYSNTGVLGSAQDIANAYNSANIDQFNKNNDKMSFWQGASRILDDAAKGYSTGSAAGPLVGVGLAIGNGLASGARLAFAGSQRDLINNSKDLALNRTLNNLSTQAENTIKQNNLNSLANMVALGGQLDYNIDDKYLANDYMSKLNNRVYKPQFDSMNYFAMGGMPDFNEFNTGGTHEQNPNGGIPQGMDKQGVMNTVEQGETKTTTPEGDYIFSDRLKLSKEECKQLGVPKDSTYAEASKILRKEYDEMPNDEIARRGWEQSRDMLIQSQEIQKQEIALKEARKQGLNSPKMYGVNPQVMQGVYYNENPQEEVLLQQGINTNIYNAFGGNIRRFDGGGFNVENLKYAPIAANIAGLAQNLFTPEDYSMPNRLQKEINALPRVSVPKNTNYMTYNPVDVNRYTNQYNAQTAAQRNAIMNTSNPNRNAALASAIYNANIGYGDLVQAIEAQNAKEKQAVQQFNAGIDQQNIANQLQADNINQNYEQMRINGIMQELAMRDAIQTARANAIQSNLKGLTDNMYNVYVDDQARRQAEIWHAGQVVPPNLKMQYLNKSINDQQLYTGLKNQGYDQTKANSIMKSMGIDISNLKWE